MKNIGIWWTHVYNFLKSLQKWFLCLHCRPAPVYVLFDVRNNRRKHTEIMLCVCVLMLISAVIAIQLILCVYVRVRMWPIVGLEARRFLRSPGNSASLCTHTHTHLQTHTYERQFDEHDAGTQLESNKYLDTMNELFLFTLQKTGLFQRLHASAKTHQKI